MRDFKISRSQKWVKAFNNWVIWIFLGRQFDKNGNMRQWWTNRTIAEYINRTKCFIDQYDSYYIEEVDDYVMSLPFIDSFFSIFSSSKIVDQSKCFVCFQIDGKLTLGENIADNGGLREAYHAYKLYVESNGKEQLLPGLEQFSHEQLLFISFGNVRNFVSMKNFFCEIFS